MSRRADQRGFALLIVLWALALLALLGSTITAAGRSETKLAANLLAAANAQAAADGAIAVAAFHLLDGSDRHWQADSSAHQLTIGESDVTLTLEDQGGKIDPNDAPPGLTAALMRHLGVADETADAVSKAITDWRSVNDMGLGSEYAALGRGYGPPHEPFQSLDEMALVIGMTPQLLALIRPHMSLYIEQTPDPARADPAVAAAIKDAVHRGQLTVNEGEQTGPLIVRIIAQARNRGAVFTRTALLRMNGIANQPYEILEWSGG